MKREIIERAITYVDQMGYDHPDPDLLKELQQLLDEPDDLTIAYMAGIERGKDIVRAEIENKERITCPCGDEYPIDSRDAGFIVAVGHCENCHASSQGILDSSKQEPVGEIREDGAHWNPSFVDSCRSNTFLYTHPKLTERLSEEEVEKIGDPILAQYPVFHKLFNEFSNAIQDALMEKNK